MKFGMDPDILVSERSKSVRLDKECNDDGTSPESPKFLDRSIFSRWLKSIHSRGTDPDKAVPEKLSSVSVARQAEKFDSVPESCV